MKHTRESEFISVARQLLERFRRPMHPREIWEEGKQSGLFTDKISGRTPSQTIKSKLSVYIRTRGDHSEFIRTGPGKFYLRKYIENQTIYTAPKLRPSRRPERVLVFPSSDLERIGRFQGIKRDGTATLDIILSSKTTFYKDRNDADPAPVKRTLFDESFAG